MEYDKMTKAELIEKLEEQQHLAQAVEAKDKEISELKKDKKGHIKDYETRISHLAKELKEKENALLKSVTPEKHKEEIEKVWNEAQITIDKANLVLQNHTQVLALFNSAMAVINQNDKFLSEKINK